MSLYRVVKLLYSLTFSILYFILWNMIAFLIVRLMPDTRVFVLGLGMICLMQFLSTKYSQKAIIFLPSCILGAITLILMFGISDYLGNIIYVVLNMFILAKEDENSIEYSTYRKRIIVGIYSLVAMGIILLAVNADLRTYLLRFYILFLISSIILLRESRRFHYNIRGKKTILTNILVMISVVVLTTDKMFKLVTSVLRVFWIGIGYITAFIVVIFVQIFTPITNYFEAKLARNTHKTRLSQPEEVDANKLLEQLRRIDSQREIPPQVVFAFKVIVLITMVFIVYKLYKRYRYNGSKEIEGVIEQRQKITKEKTREKKSLASTLKELFGEKDIRAQILKVYQSFEKKTYEKNIFKRHMTATQLYYVSKTYIENAKPIKSITEIYNKAKFSQHTASEEALSEIKKYYKSIKNHIEEVKN